MFPSCSVSIFSPFFPTPEATLALRLKYILSMIPTWSLYREESNRSRSSRAHPLPLDPLGRSRGYDAHVPIDDDLWWFRSHAGCTRDALLSCASAASHPPPPPCPGLWSIDIISGLHTTHAESTMRFRVCTSPPRRDAHDNANAFCVSRGFGTGLPFCNAAEADLSRVNSPDEGISGSRGFGAVWRRSRSKRIWGDCKTFFLRYPFQDVRVQ